MTDINRNIENHHSSMLAKAEIPFLIFEKIEGNAL